MVSLGAKNVQSEDDVQGNQRPLPGRYHVSVKDLKCFFKSFDENSKEEKWNKCDETDDYCGKLSMTFEVLKGTTPGQEGREIEEAFYTSEKALPRLQRLAIVLGLLQPGEAERPVLFSDGIGRQLVIEVVENKYNDRSGKEVTGSRVSWMGLWSLNNKAVEDVPKDQEALKFAAGGGSRPDAGGNRETVAASSGDDKWADL